MTGVDDALPRWHHRERHRVRCAMGFTPVVRTGTELVYAGIGRPWSPTGGMRSVTSLDSFRDFTEPGWAKMAVDFRADNDDFSGAILGDEGGV